MLDNHPREQAYPVAAEEALEWDTFEEDTEEAVVPLAEHQPMQGSYRTGDQADLMDCRQTVAVLLHCSNLLDTKK